MEDQDVYYDNLVEDDDELKGLEDTESIFFDMSSNDFLESEIDDQLNVNLFNYNKRNHVELYLEKFKYLKNVYEQDGDTLEELFENKENFIANIISMITEKFAIEIDADIIGNKAAKTLYNFFVVYYYDNIKSFFINYIQKNKKIILTELKKQKSKIRDVTSVASKSKFNNSQDALLLNNIESVLFDIIPSEELGENFINFITDYDDDITNINITKFIDKGEINLENTYENFLEPFINREDGYAEIISDIIIKLSEDMKFNDIKLFKDEK